MKKKNGKLMKDGTRAWLTSSGIYYARRYPTYNINEGIAYYSKKGMRIPLARGICEKCGDILQSKRCGDFCLCFCGESFVDTDRMTPERHRYGGHISSAKELLNEKEG